ncbi:hypothetical protein U8527_01925 [Kordia algicida OT-1]|uniref:Uncharacterized protein n=1 Tax=Kordia algicida OT-1 TaxID=391587 RepID=A9DTE2_9FLAO|nr:hypothetical protein [Kordia algicida]EDP97061.1 hypothetical protein KAOT1_17898 [Kordia algicida OT-1]
MQILFFLLIFIISFSSLIITFIAIVKILSNDFNDSKPKWILISMIAFIGPVLWLTKGRKLLIKKEDQQFVEKKEKISLKEHYSELFKNIGIPLKVFFLLSVLLIGFGYFARLFHIYFFWESTSVGFVLLLIALVKFFSEDISLRIENQLNKIFCYAVIVVLCGTIFFKILITTIIFNSNAFIAAKNYLKKDSELISEIGEIESFSFLPKGSMSIHKDQYGTVGNADMTIIIKGKKKYVEKNILLIKKLEEDWTVIQQ